MQVFMGILIGFLAGYLSGQFGIGGGLLTTPAIRIILQRGAFISLGTPLLVIIPAAVTGAVNYYRNRLVDTQLGINLAIFGIAGAVAGALITPFFRGSILMIITALIILLVSIRYIYPPFYSKIGFSFSDLSKTEEKFPMIMVASLLGLVVGFYSGFLGLGGGFLIIPGLTVLFNLPIKKAIGTSLFVISFLAVPGAVTHYFLGHVDLGLALLLIGGTIPGAYLGSKIAIGMNERLLRILFGSFLALTAVYFIIFEIIIILR